MYLLYVKVWTAHVCSVANAVHIHVTHTYVSQDEGTALHLAAHEGHEDVVELLLEAKADPELRIEVLTLKSIYRLSGL